MIVKTGANYQADGGYIEASISNDIIKFKTGNIDMRTPVSSTNLYGALVTGHIKLNGASAPIPVSSILLFTGSHRYVGSKSISPDTETNLTWITETDLLVSGFITTAGYTNPVLSPNSKNCSIFKSGNSYYISITGDDFLIDIVEGQ